MKTQHTPGPWNLQTQSTFDNCGIKAEVTLPGSKEKGWLTIAECNYDLMIKAISATQHDHHKRSNDVAFLRSLSEANAHLIAAAPELLSACEYAFECLSKLTMNTGDLGDQAYQALESAIKKAKGE